MPRILVCLFFYSVFAQAQSSLFYVGGSGADQLNDIVQLSNGKFLLAGATDDLSWIPDPSIVTEWSVTEIANNQGSDQFAYLMILNEELDSIEQFIHFSQGAAEDIRFIKTTNIPRAKTGDMYISGTTRDSDDGGYFIARLNDNFVDGIPTRMDWVVNVKCADGGYPARNQPWDVDAEGRVYYVRGDSHAYNWSAMYRLGPDGERQVVEHWRTHWKVAGGEYRATPASSFPEGIDALQESGIVFKRDGRCNMRSWTYEEYEEQSPDGNGGVKQGKWPMDVLFSGPCDPEEDNPNTSGPGYTGYKPAGIFTYGPSVVTVDRRNGDVYLGINMRSVLPGGQPDFEPAVVRFDRTGKLVWWTRLYHEVRADSSKHNSTPDQYIDGVAIDYAFDNVIVNARCHGNNVENFWEGNTINSRPSANAWKNQFTGSSGNIHISWLGRLDMDATLLASTYVAEMPNGAKGAGARLTDPLMDGWPNPNAGWPDLNTTRLVPNTLKVTGDGHVLIVGQGRRTMTTANAYQKMPKPGNGTTSRWNHFIRQYEDDFTRPMYSSLVAPPWDTLNEQGGLEVRVHNFFKTDQGVVFVGEQNGQGRCLLTSGVPSFGKTCYDSTEAVIGYYKAFNLASDKDDVVHETTGIIEENPVAVKIWPNPSLGVLRWSVSQPLREVRLLTSHGRTVKSTQGKSMTVTSLVSGSYVLQFEFTNGDVQNELWIKQ